MSATLSASSGGAGKGNAHMPGPRSTGQARRAQSRTIPSSSRAETVPIDRTLVRRHDGGLEWQPLADCRRQCTPAKKQPAAQEHTT
eukprot:1735501-Prymnesium_polylepis.1